MRFLLEDEYVKRIYRLEIRCQCDPSIIAQTLSIEPSATDERGWWLLEVAEEEDDPPHDFVSHFLSLLDGKYAELRQLGVTSDCISIWLLYEYDHQCSLELSPQQTKRLGEAGITLCISCWESGTTPAKTN